MSKAQQNEDTLVKTYEQGLKNLITTETKLNGAMMKGIAAYTKWISNLAASNKAQIEQTKRTKSDNKIRADSLIVKQKMKDADEHLIKLRSRLRLEEEREHGEQVRRNITLRDKNEGFIASLQFATKSLTGGFGFQAAIGTTVKNFGQLTKKFNTIKLSSESLSKAQQNLQKKSTDLSIARMTQDKPTIKKAEAEYEAAKSEVISKLNVASEEQLGEGVESKQLKPVFSRLSKLGEFLGKKAVPIGLGIGVAGVIMSVIVKAFSASPLFAQMMKLMKFMVTLILMPIGTFFGALLRPILILLLRKFIVPMYSQFMPLALKVGGQIGKWISGLGSGSRITPDFDDNFETNPWWEMTTEELVSALSKKLNETDNPTEIIREADATSLIGAPTLEDYDPNAGYADGKFQPKDGGTYDPYAGRPIPEYAGSLEHVLEKMGENGTTGKNSSDSYDSNEHMSTWGSSGNFNSEDEYKNPVIGNAESVLTENQKMIQRYIKNPDLIAQEQNFKNAINTGGVITETVKEVVKSINPHTGLVSHIKDAGANIEAANASNASAGYTMGGTAKSQSILEAYNAFKNGVTAANGFDGMVNSPTMFLAGEAGSEHVTVTPNGQGGGSSIVVNIGTMNGSDNDLRKLKKTILEVIQESSANRGRL